MWVVAIDEVATFLPELGLSSDSPFFFIMGLICICYGFNSGLFNVGLDRNI